MSIIFKIAPWEPLKPFWALSYDIYCAGVFQRAQNPPKITLHSNCHSTFAIKVTKVFKGTVT